MSPRTLVTLLTLIVLTSALGASDLHFIIHGVDASLGGTVSAGVYASEDGYLEPGYEVAGVVATVSGDTATGVFRDLPAGGYVIAVMHDLDGDGEMDKNGLGMPLEGYGFSGTTRPVTLPPKYEKAATMLDGSENKTVDVHMKY